jgi:RHS repeat-associated protein
MYTYDGDGRLTGLTYAPGQHITRDYHDEGRFVKVSDWLGNTTTFYYTQAGILNEVDYPNGTCAARDSDTVVLTRCGDKKKGIAAFTYHRNNDGQVISAKASIAGTGNGRDDVFGYSATGALNLVKSPRKNAPDGRYRYDAIGDLTEFPDGTTFAVVGGQIQSRQTAAGDLLTGFHYNSAGDRTSTVTSSGTTIDLSYDQAERLTGYGGQVQYTYDGDGLLATRTAAGHTTSFTWDRSAQTPLLLSDGTAQYIYGPDGQPFEQIVGSQITYLLTDAQNSVRLLTDSKGKVAGSYSYSPYGHVDHRTGKTTTALQFDSQYTDQACGCQYLRNRFYDLDTAEFLTPDPDLNETGTPYGFAAGDPLDRADPTGQFPKWLGITLLTVAFIAVTVLTDGADLPELGALEELNGARTLGQLERIGESGARAAEEEAASDGATSAATTGTARTATTRIQFGPLKIERTTTDTRPVVLDASQQEASRAAGTSNSSLFGRVFTTDRKNNIKKRLKNPLFWAGAAGKAHGVYQACVGQNTDAANCASSIL